MFQYQKTEVETVTQQMRALQTGTEDLMQSLATAIKPIEEGGWIGEAGTSFLTSWALLKRSFEEMTTEFSEFGNALQKASNIVDSASTDMARNIANLP